MNHAFKQKYCSWIFHRNVYKNVFDLFFKYILKINPKEQVELKYCLLILF